MSYDMAQAGTPFFVLFDKQEANGDVKIMGVAQDQFYCLLPTRYWGALNN